MLPCLVGKRMEMGERERKEICFHFENYMSFSIGNFLSLLHSPNIDGASDTRLGASFSQESQFSSSKSSSPQFLLII